MWVEQNRRSISCSKGRPTDQNREERAWSCVLHSSHFVWQRIAISSFIGSIGVFRWGSQSGVDKGQWSKGAGDYKNCSNDNSDFGHSLDYHTVMLAKSKILTDDEKISTLLDSHDIIATLRMNDRTKIFFRETQPCVVLIALSIDENSFSDSKIA